MTFVQPGPIRDDYAGPGGWSEGLRMLGLTDVGIEWDADACATRIAAGHATIRADLATYRTTSPLWGYIASPPCQTFSVAGSGEGRKLIAKLVKIVHDGDWPQADHMDKRTRHVIDVARNCDEIDAEWICLEQVPSVLPIWQAIAHRLRARGYSVWCGVVNSANYGVPQTRKRAVLIASRVRTVTAPPATHDKAPSHDLFSEPLLPWISMASALGWNGWVDRRQGETDDAGVRHHRPKISTDQPAPMLTVQAGASSQWLVQRDEAWAFEHPAPTISGGGTATGGAEPIANQGLRDKIEASRRAAHRLAAVIVETPVRIRPRALVVATGQQSSRHDRNPDHAELYERPTNRPAPTVTGSADQWSIGAPGHRRLNPGRTGSQPNRRTYDADEPAPTLAFGHDAASWCWENPAPTVTGGRDGAAVGGSRIRAKMATGWPYDRQATTVCGDPRLGEPGHRDRAGGEPQFAADAVRLDIPEALVLQSFRDDYPLAGTRSSQFQQVGNAIPPLLAMHCAAMATGIQPAE
jgi:DNA (cytosine-5)-methyltransferase 1